MLIYFRFNIIFIF
ncbi:putative membrane protein, partial [Yersinia pestis PY-113]